MKESYTLILNSLNDSNKINIDNQTSIQYYINWSSVIPYNPDKKQKYKLSFSLRTEPNLGDISQPGLLEIIMGQTHSYEQSGTSNIIGCIHPSKIDVEYYYISLPNDNMPVQVEYPSSSLITVNFLDFDKVTAFNMLHYVLILTFEEL